MRKFSKKEKNIIQYAFLVFLILVTGIIISKTIDYRRIPDVIAFADKRYLLAGVMVILLYILLETIIFQWIINSIEKNKQKRSIGIQMGTIGLYYNLVTPFASGSQPMQIYLMNKYGISLSRAVAIVTNKTMLFQSVVTVICGGVILFNQEMIMERHSSIIPLLTAGMAMNIVSIIVGIMIVLNPEFMKKVADFIIYRLGKLRMFRFLNGKNERVHHYIDDFNKSILMYISDWKSLIATVMLTFIQLFLYFSIAFLIYKASKLSGAGFFRIFSCQVLLYMTISPIPTPGNVGANEITFFNIFNGLFPKQYVGYAVIMYSFFVYYFILLFCGVCTWISHYMMDRNIEKKRKDRKRENKHEQFLTN
ncbi:flippase-like domain-containing protein [Peptacetobacter hominis]|uniref:Phosphatidylglycerol lysyltransferase n=1 Tax=Peptacetobacter hominis TaxID=2743610 RepID=A0A544QVT1_9FIRM|nr:lysylphosphatidylglycerol synthase transmembrane domain-containing protein [Peptacetobacter hominis]TQQ84805.1 flippase-like domain-containing protein [Peptacetobacter hominis]